MCVPRWKGFLKDEDPANNHCPLSFPREGGDKVPANSILDFLRQMQQASRDSNFANATRLRQ